MVRRMTATARRGQGTVPPHSGRESFCEAAGRLPRISRFDQYQIVEDLLLRSGYTVGCQAPSTNKASFSPGQGGIVAPIALRASGPSQRN
jgi:hypothetical protein